MSHPDEGLIHAWLDGELDVAEAARIAALVRDDPAWGAAAAEARGLIAATARIVGALDHVPANVVPKSREVARVGAAGAGTSTAPRRMPWWAMRAAAALVVATGTVVVFSRTSPAPGDLANGEPAKVGAALRANDAREVATTAAPVVTAPAAAPQKLKDAPAGSGGAALSGAAGAAVNEADALRRGTLADARVEGKFAASELARRDRTEPAKQTSTDEKRLAAADQAAASVAGALKKESGSATGEVAKAQSTVGQPAVPAPASAAAGVRAAAEVEPRRAPPVNAISREECYREPTTAAGGASVVHRVGRTGDSTAIAGALVGLRGDVSSFRARQAQNLAASQAPNSMRVRGDTLFVSVVNGVTRIALRITCPAP